VIVKFNIKMHDLFEDVSDSKVYKQINCIITFM